MSGTTAHSAVKQLAARLPVAGCRLPKEADHRLDGDYTGTRACARIMGFGYDVTDHNRMRTSHLWRQDTGGASVHAEADAG